MKLSGLVISFLSIPSLAVLAHPSLSKRVTVLDIEGFLARLTTEANAAANDIQALESSQTLVAALALHNAMSTLNSDLTNGTTSIVDNPPPLPLSTVDAATIVHEANTGLTPAINSVLTGISSFPDTPNSNISTLVGLDGRVLESDSTIFYNALESILPADAGSQLIFPGPVAQTGA